jgi:hypothetical protein
MIFCHLRRISDLLTSKKKIEKSGKMNSRGKADDGTEEQTALHDHD